MPATAATAFPVGGWLQSITDQLQNGMPFYYLLFIGGIIFFAYFYTAIIFNPDDVAENMRKHGGFIPGIRPGKRTSDFIDRILTRITLPGSIFLASIAVFPFFITNYLGVHPGLNDFFGGTGLLIIVGVALDTLQQIESHLLMRHYDGFMKKGSVKGRR